ncbi:klhl3 [Symbiodinium sp. CCMP2592]|nr:klhl3 [Symbiodinium sp. CCMP2592]
MEIPSSFKCKLSSELMKDPVMVDAEEPEGCNTYERVEIERWLEMNADWRDPYTNIRLRSKDLRENADLRKDIRDWSAQNAEYVKRMAELERQVRDAQLALETRNYVPKRFVCGLSKQVMRRPVRARDGNVYDKKALEEYVRLSETSGELLSPVTQKPMDQGYHLEAELEEEIRQFLEENFPAKESAWKHMRTPREAPAQWPALMSATNITPRTFSKQAAMTEAAFHGSVSSREGPEIKTVVSFPGQYQEDWYCLVRRSVKRIAFEAEDPDRPCAHYLSGSTACVFLPQGSKLYGGHMPNEDGTPSSCWCQDLYDKKQSFGCRWFEEWRLRVQLAVERKHTLMVVYKAGQKGVGREGLTWPPRIECSAARRGDAGLGVSQRGEVAWLLRHGISFEEEDIHEYRRRLAADIKLELKELHSRSPLPSLRDMQSQFEAHLETELDGLRDRLGESDLDDQGSLHRLNVLFSALDDLNDVLVATLGSWRAPFLVVFGAESVGKSSLLQRLSLLPFFPTDRSRCTRMPVRLEIRRTATPHPATLQVWNVRERKWEGPARSISLEVSESQIHTEMNKLVEETAQGSEFCLDKEIHIKAGSTTLPPMNLVDLPGLVQADAGLAAQTKQLLERYTQDSQDQDIFLAVVQASDAPANWAVMQLIKDKHLEERTIGVITKFDRLGEDEHEDLFPVLRGEQVKGLVPLSRHGFVAVANVTNKRDAGESFTEWMARKVQMEQNKFAIDWEMKTFVENQQASIGAVVYNISRAYGWHVAHNWLPLTAKRLLAVWTGCCEELVEMGLPFASGQLEGAALEKFKSAASHELMRRFSFVFQRTRELFWSTAAKPVKDCLQQQLKAVEEQEVELLDRRAHSGVFQAEPSPLKREVQELPMFLETACKEILSKLPLEPFAPGLLEEALTALAPRKEDSFRLERLPRLIEELLTKTRSFGREISDPTHFPRPFVSFSQEVKRKLQETQPRLDMKMARQGVAEVLKSVFVEHRHLTMQVDQKGMVKVSFDFETLATRCLGAVAGAFQGFGSEKQFENDAWMHWQLAPGLVRLVEVISPALEATKSVPEDCLDRRRQVFEHMEKCAEALEKLVKTRTSLAESLDSSDKPLEPRTKVLQHWLQGETVPVACEVIWGDSAEDQSFTSPACNFVASVLKDVLLQQRRQEEAAKLVAMAPVEFETAVCPPLQHPTYSATAAALDGRIYVIGGEHTQRTVQIFDISRNVWSQGPELSCQRVCAAAAVIGSRIYVTGGSDRSDNSRLSSMECWSPQSAGGWSLGTDSGQRRCEHAAVELQGRLVLLGGYDGSQLLAHVQRFDPGSERWEELPPMRERRSALAAAVVSGKIFAVGGYAGKELSSVEVFDPANGGSWGTGPSLLSRRRACHAAATVAGRLYVFGSNISAAQRSTEFFDASAGSWAEGPALKHPRCHSAAAVWDDTLYVLGGEASETRKSVEVLPSVEMRMRRALAGLNWVPACP